MSSMFSTEVHIYILEYTVLGAEDTMATLRRVKMAAGGFPLKASHTEISLSDSDKIKSPASRE